MLDHVLLDVIATVRDGFEAALLERQPGEERFQVDVFLGDLSWEGSYSLPGEGYPPRVRADIGLVWPTWSQSAYRSWSIGEPHDEPPELLVEVALRVQRLAVEPGPAQMLAVLPEPPLVGTESLERSGPTIEKVFGEDLATSEHAGEVAYDGTLSLDDAILGDPAALRTMLSGLASWVASTLVRLADLDLAFLPPGDDPPGDDEESIDSP
ncbi:MAG: hypothetical protein ACRDY2_07050 [Acidimicrobiales bacterium]